MRVKIVRLNAQILSQLVQKQPNGNKTSVYILLRGSIPNIHLVKLKPIDEEMIIKIAIITDLQFFI